LQDLFSGSILGFVGVVFSFVSFFALLVFAVFFLVSERFCVSSMSVFFFVFLAIIPCKNGVSL